MSLIIEGKTCDDELVCYGWRQYASGLWPKLKPEIIRSEDYFYVTDHEPEEDGGIKWGEDGGVWIRILDSFHPNFKDKIEKQKSINPGDKLFVLKKETLENNRLYISKVYFKRESSNEIEHFNLPALFCSEERYPKIKYRLNNYLSDISYAEYIKNKEYKQRIKRGEVKTTELAANTIINLFVPCCTKMKNTLFIIVLVSLFGITLKERAILWLVCGLWYFINNAICLSNKHDVK